MDVTAQVALLERRGLSFADKSRAEEFLLRENYYAVVNGYKDAFIDRQATNLAHDDRYAQGTSFEDLMLI
jgi:abortive infection bacteriophage resistance protein